MAVERPISVGFYGQRPVQVLGDFRMDLVAVSQFLFRHRNPFSNWGPELRHETSR